MKTIWTDKQEPNDLVNTLSNCRCPVEGCKGRTWSTKDSKRTTQVQCTECKKEFSLIWNDDNSLRSVVAFNDWN